MPGRHALLPRHARTPAPGRHCGRLAPAGPDPRLAAVPVAVGAVALAGVPAAAASGPTNVREIAQPLHSTARSMGPANVAAAVPAYPLPAGSYFGYPAQHTGRAYAPTLISGSEPPAGPDARVRTVQQRLLAHGGGLGTAGADGYFGSRTDQATRLFQQTQGLRVDGLVGPRTWAALWEAPETLRAVIPAGYDMEGAKPHVVTAALELGPRFGITRLSADVDRQNSTGDHPRGLAVDFFTFTGYDLSRYAVANAGRLRISYVIWNRQIWHAARAAEGWRYYGGPSPHVDHVHVSFRA